jgi:hypothetical protein
MLFLSADRHRLRATTSKYGGRDVEFCVQAGAMRNGPKSSTKDGAMANQRKYMQVYVVRETLPYLVKGR